MFDIKQKLAMAKRESPTINHIRCATNHRPTYTPGPFFHGGEGSDMRGREKTHLQRHDGRATGRDERRTICEKARTRFTMYTPFCLNY